MQFHTLLLSVLVLLAGCAQDNKENRLTQTEVTENEDAAAEKRLSDILSESDRAQAAAYAKAYAFVKKKGGSDDKAVRTPRATLKPMPGNTHCGSPPVWNRGEAHNNALHFTSCYMAQRDAGLSKKKAGTFASLYALERSMGYSHAYAKGYTESYLFSQSQGIGDQTAIRIAEEAGRKAE